MTDARRTRIEPPPTPEEAAAITAALTLLDAEKPAAEVPAWSRWRLAGLLGHPVPSGTQPERSLWSYSSWKGGH